MLTNGSQNLLGKDLEKIILKAEITTLSHLMLCQINMSYVYYIGYLLMSYITQIPLNSSLSSRPGLRLSLGFCI